MSPRFNELEDAHGLLLLRQSAYRTHPSTENAATDVHNRLVETIDSDGDVGAVVLFHLRCALYTVDHAIEALSLSNAECYKVPS